MPPPRSRSRDDDDDDDDDRPRRRRRYDDDDDDDYDYDDRPRSRRRRRDDDDEPPPRRPRRKSGGVSTGKILGIVGGIIGIVAVVVVVILLAKGGLGGASISYAKFQAINSSDTIQSLEKKFGKPKKLERSEWASVEYAKEDTPFGGGRGGRGGRATLADLEPWGSQLDAWYHWHSGSEDIYVAVGKHIDGKSGLLMKVYANSNALEHNRRAGDPSKFVPSYEVLPVN